MEVYSMSFLRSLPAVVAFNVSKIAQERDEREKAKALELQKAQEEAEKLRRQVQSNKTFGRIFWTLGLIMLGLAGLDLIVEGHLPFMQLALGGLSLTISSFDN